MFVFLPLASFFLDSVSLTVSTWALGEVTVWKTYSFIIFHQDSDELRKPQSWKTQNLTVTQMMHTCIDFKSFEAMRRPSLFLSCCLPFDLWLFHPVSRACIMQIVTLENQHICTESAAPVCLRYHLKIPVMLFYFTGQTCTCKLVCWSYVQKWLNVW